MDKSPKGESALIEPLGEFLSALASVHECWLSPQPGLVGGLEEAYERLGHANVNVRQFLDEECVASAICPPPGVSRVQYLKQLRHILDKAWHLCRFVFVQPPDSIPDDPDAKRIALEMHEQLPALHAELREIWLRLRPVATQRVASPSAGDMGGESGAPAVVNKAAQYIDAHPGAKAIAIAKHCGIASSTFYTHYSPKLRALGYRPRSGKGFFPPTNQAGGQSSAT